MRNPHDLYIFRLARALKPPVYQFVRTLPQSEEFNLKAQMRSSVGSISNNIREGCNRQGDRAFLPFLYTASGSAGELEDQFQDALDLRLGDQREARRLRRRVVWLEMKIKDFIHAVERRTAERDSRPATRPRAKARYPRDA